jgi:hypothetical protein
MKIDRFERIIKECREHLIREHKLRENGNRKSDCIGVCDVLGKYGGLKIEKAFQRLLSPQTHSCGYWLGKTRGTKKQMRKSLKNRLLYLDVFCGTVISSGLYKNF